MAFDNQSINASYDRAEDALNVTIGPVGLSIPSSAVLDILSGNDRDPTHLAWQMAVDIAANFSPAPTQITPDIAAFLNTRTYQW